MLTIGLLKIFHGHSVAVETITGKGLFAGEANIGDLAEIFAGVDVGQMYFAGRNANGLERIENGDAGVGVSGWIDHNSVNLLIGLLDAIDDRALMVGLEQLDLHAQPR